MNATRRRLVPVVAALAGAAIAAGLVSGEARAHREATNLQVFTTYHGLINPGTLNQGWWSGTPGIFNTNGNDSYKVVNGPLYSTHDFFTFDISQADGCQPESGLIALFDGWGGLGAPYLTYGLFDVSTDPYTLNAKATNPNAAIFHDLGSGESYGKAQLPMITYFFHQTAITLSRAALNAFGRAERAHQRYFSIGGALLDQLPEGGYLWDVPSGQGLFATLQFVDGKTCRVET